MTNGIDWQVQDVAVAWLAATHHSRLTDHPYLKYGMYFRTMPASHSFSTMVPRA